MAIEPNNAGSGSGWFVHCYSSGSVQVRLMNDSQLRIWFGHNCNCKKLGALEKCNARNKKPKPIAQTVPHANDNKCDCSQFRLSESVHS